MRRGFVLPLPPLVPQMSPSSRLCLLTIVALILPSRGKTPPPPPPLAQIQSQGAARWVIAKLKYWVPSYHSTPSPNPTE